MWDFHRGVDLSEDEQKRLLTELVEDLSFWGPLLPPSKKTVTRSPKANKSDTASVNSSCGPLWRTAVDSTTGKTYYYDSVTRRTQWEKPAALREMERRQKREKKKRDEIFFKQMEQNIRDNLAKGQQAPSPLDMPKLVAPEEQLPRPKKQNPRSRTISGMDDVLLQELQSASATPAKFVVLPISRRDAHGRPPLPARRGFSEQPSDLSLEFSPEGESRLAAVAEHPLLLQRDESEASDQTELRGEALLDGPIDEDVYEVGLPKNQQHVRRNTGGTIYAESTMMNPDVEATIKCVCGVYRAHIVQASNKRTNRSPVSVSAFPNHNLGEIFLDHSPGTEVPPLDEIIAFYHDFYVRSQMEHDTIIMSLIYVERLIKEDTVISPYPENWRSVLFSCMVLASKVWDDLSMWNIDFSNVCGRGGGLAVYTLPRINQLELALLKALNFNVKVPASEYAKYYFLIRSMLIKSGLLTEEKQKSAPQKAAPAKKAGHRVARSLNDQGFQSLDNDKAKSSVSLEQLLSMTTY